MKLSKQQTKTLTYLQDVVDYVMQYIDNLHMMAHKKNKLKVEIKTEELSKYTLDEASSDLETCTSLISTVSMAQIKGDALYNSLFRDYEANLYQADIQLFKQLNKSSTNFRMTFEGVNEHEEMVLTVNTLRALNSTIENKIRSLMTIIATKRDIMKLEFNTNKFYNSDKNIKNGN